MLQQVRRESIFLEWLMCGGGVRSVLLLPLMARCVVSVCCVHFVFFYCIISSAHMSATVIVRTLESIWLNPFAVTVLLNVRSAVSHCVFCTHVAWVYLLLCKEEGSSPVSLKITERRDMDTYEVPLSVSLLGWGIC